MLVVISIMYVPICNRFHAIRANSGKITSFQGVPHFSPSFEGNPLTQGHKNLSRYTRLLGASHGEDFAILACTVLIQSLSVTDRQTDRRPGHG